MRPAGRAEKAGHKPPFRVMAVSVRDDGGRAAPWSAPVGWRIWALRPVQLTPDNARIYEQSGVRSLGMLFWHGGPDAGWRCDGLYPFLAPHLAQCSAVGHRFQFFCCCISGRFTDRRRRDARARPVACGHAGVCLHGVPAFFHCGRAGASQDAARHSDGSALDGCWRCRHRLAAFRDAVTGIGHRNGVLAGCGCAGGSVAHRLPP